MDGLVGQLRATPGNRDALAHALIDEVGAMPGCLYYVVSADPVDADLLWITEAWDEADSHQAWLASDATRALIERIRPLMVGYDSRVEPVPLGGNLGAGGPLPRA